jgi:hypothetical protein
VGTGYKKVIFLKEKEFEKNSKFLGIRKEKEIL